MVVAIRANCMLRLCGCSKYYGLHVKLARVKIISASDYLLLRHTITMDIYTVKDKMCPYSVLFDLHWYLSSCYRTIRQRQEA